MEERPRLAESFTVVLPGADAEVPCHALRNS